MYECIYCLFHIFPTRVFLETRIGSSPDASSPHNFDVSITPMQPTYQPQPKLFKMIILSIHGLLCSCSLPRVRQKAIMCSNGHGNLGRDKLRDFKVCLRLQKFMSLVLQRFHVIVWSSFTMFFDAYF